MTKNNLAIVLPLIFAALLICALVLVTCAYCYNPMFLIRMRRRDEESSDGSAAGREKRPRVVLQSEIVSVTSTSSSSSDSSSTISSVPTEGIPVQVATPDVDPSTVVVEVQPDGPNILEANPQR